MDSSGGAGRSELLDGEDDPTPERVRGLRRSVHCIGRLLTKLVRLLKGTFSLLSKSGSTSTRTSSRLTDSRSDCGYPGNLS